MSASDTWVSITCGLFQGSFGAAVTHERVTECLEDAHRRLEYRSSGTVVRGLRVELVKYARKGRLGDVLFMWNFPGLLQVPKAVMHDVGSIQLTCKTIPFNHKVSIFIFSNGKIKLCGKMIDPVQAVTAFASGDMKDHDAVHDAMQAYLDQVKECACHDRGRTTRATI